MKKFKVITVLGTRPEIIRMSEIIKAFNKYFDHKLIFTGQNYSKELSSFFFKNFKIKPDFNLNINNKSPALAISGIIKETDEILKKINPDCFFVLGDTNSALSAIIAKKRKIPIFHYEAGNRCFDERVPEEINRKLIDHISDINFTYSLNAKQNLINENISNDLIINLGSPLKEVIDRNIKKINGDKILKKLKLKKNKYFLLSLHREENIDDKKNLTKIINCLNYVVEKYNIKMIVTLHPRVKNKILKFKLNKKIFLYPPFNFFEYNKLQINAKIVFSDSGSISEESYLLKFPAINLRETQERHEAMEKSIVPISSFKPEKMMNLIKMTLENFTMNMNEIPDYEQANVSHKIIKILPSYTDYIRRKKYFIID